MSKAEDRALEAFPLKEDGDSRGSYDLNVVKRIIYQQGYKQAEKDLELTWEDIKLIWNITDELENMSEEEFYNEVLKRFKEKKGK